MTGFGAESRQYIYQPLHSEVYCVVMKGSSKFLFQSAQTSQIGSGIFKISIFKETHDAFKRYFLQKFK